MTDEHGRAATRRTVLRASAAASAGLALGGGPLRSAFAAGTSASADSTAPFTPTEIFFNAHHSPIGAYSTFTLGFKGANGGFGLQQKLPGTQSTFIGVLKNGQPIGLPFFDTTANPELAVYADSAITRDFRVASDAFATPDFSFTLLSPVRSILDPTGEKTGKISPLLPKGQLLDISSSGKHPIEDVLLPAVFAEMVVDNSTGGSEITAVFAVDGGSASVLGTSVPAVAFPNGGGQTAIATEHAGATPFTAASIAAAMQGQFGSGDVGGIGVTVAAGAKETIRFALCFYQGGPVTSGQRALPFWYTQYYDSLEAVVTKATTHLPATVASFAADNEFVDNASITANQKFLLSQAIHSYYGNTTLLLDTDGSPWWVVLEGQYQYINTFDLSVDQQFFEIGMNPWTVRNVLEHSSQYYSYTDTVETSATTTGAGGIAFTHDMGQWPVFSPNGTSAYELPNVGGTFSFQTGEELVNWILIAGVYVAQTNDLTFLENNESVFEAILSSMSNRDNPDPSQRDGIESFNSSKVGTGYEITTYDSVGPGLTEAVGNTYLGGKYWAGYVILEGLLALSGRLDLAAEAVEQAALAAAKITSFMTSAGYIASNVYNGESIPIIPVVEGLVYPYLAARTDAVSATGIYGSYVQALGKHLTTVLVPGVCLTSDNGWQLDSQSANTWLSKTFLNEFVGRQILALPIRANTDAADAASVSWLTNTTLNPQTNTISALYAFSDQIEYGSGFGSEYYPRGVTSILWLQEPPAT